MISEIETTFTFRNTDPTDSLKLHATDKIEKLNKFLVKPAAAHFIFKVEGARHVAEITLHMKGGRFVGTETSNDMYTSVDGAIDKLLKQIKRTREKIKDHNP
ncbi:MAG: ribosome-associated translation inhibitor RaiA [Proteobacteria bacterium]|nr:ribosome-associated translation inhibitor RaiA [Pseudomonadota bacterium]